MPDTHTGRTDPAEPRPRLELVEIARRVLSIPTLDTRYSDSLDFHDVAVWCVREALERAYDLGRESALADAPGDTPTEHACRLVLRASEQGDLEAALRVLRAELATPCEPDAITCPDCGEFNHDHLLWQDDDTLTCQTCGTTFNPRPRN